MFGVVPSLDIPFFSLSLDVILSVTAFMPLSTTVDIGTIYTLNTRNALQRSS